jgi:3-oxoacyl-[acyl-carrier protein] reductase
MGKLDGKVALITGAGSGIGRAIACRFAAEGARVVADDLRLESAEATLTELGPDAAASHAVAADVSDPDQVRAMFAEVAQRFGRLDVLVNNAGIGESSDEEVAAVNRTAEAMLADMMAGKPPSVRFDFTRHVTDEAWQRQIGVHLSGCFYCTREALKVMIPQGSGSIVNMASAAALAGQPVFTHYTAAKGGIVSLTRAIAVEGGPFGVRVNAIAPGAIDTPMAAKLSRAYVGALIARAPIPRLGQPDEVASVALFLASDDASYVTGQVLSANGGVIM